MTPVEYFSALWRVGSAALATTVTAERVSLDEAMTRCLADLEQVRAAGGVVHLVGNGGSAAVVAHAQNDFLKAAGIKALVHQDIPLLTACANDDGYAEVFARPLAAWIRPGDALIAVSSSGMSDNILAAVQVARERGARVITCSGFGPSNELRGLGHVNFYVPSSRYGHVELTHAALLHYLTDELAHA